MTIIDLKNIIIGSKDYEEEFVRAQLSVILEERVERETEEKIARQLNESELNELRITDRKVVYVKVKGEQMANAVMDTGAQDARGVRPDVVEGQSIDNRGSIQITSAFGEHEMGEVKDSNMELNDLRHGVVPVLKIWLTTC
ncbi:hypothetical protein TNCV_1567981 [Trichonephila clavipes]|nr:hypothetical protein TNCV_1567981 [Trichonephila clavipes]